MPRIVVREPKVLAVETNPTVEHARGDVVVRVHRAGICGSDIHIFHGTNPFAVYPRVIGHEFAGEIEVIGEEVRGLSIGDRVVIDPVISCGHCYPCRVGRSNVCANLEVLGVHRDGGFRECIAVPAGNVVKVPKDMPFGVAALAEPFSIAANVLDRTGCGPNDTVLVYGAGTVGVTVIQVAKLLGARCIVADIDDARLVRARRFGVDAIVNSRSSSVPEAVKSETEGLGPTVIIDGAGVTSLLDEACRIASPAGRIGLLGFSATPSPLSQQEVVRKELTIVGSRLNRKLLPRVVEWLANKQLSPEAMITQVFSAEDARAAFDLIEREPENTLKVQLDFG